jgi:NADPH-dependent curcumin reductase CurA
MSRVFQFKQAPNGIPAESDFALATRDLPMLADNQVRAQTLYVSLDPYLRGVLSGRHLGHALQVGDAIPGEVLARVVESRAADMPVGELICAHAGWCEASVLDASQVRTLEAQIFERLAPASTAIGMLGMPGMTAWAGIRQLAKVRAGDQVLISAAAGAVGSTAAQIAKQLGARVVGVAGGPEKVALVRERLGVECLDYRDAQFAEQLRATFDKGIDVYFDNVGGDLLALALSKLALGARVVLCGLIDQYNKAERPAGPNLAPVIAARAHLMGLVVYDFLHRRAEFLADMQPWLEQKKLVWLEDIAHGFDQLPNAFVRLMQGKNIGKALVRCA